MKRKPRRVKEQGSFLKRQLKGLERSGAFKQPWEGGVLAGVQAAVPSGHSFLLNAAAPGPLLLLFQAAVKSFPTPASEPGELCSVSSHAACLPPAPGCARRFDQSCLPREPPDPHASHARDVGASSPSGGWHCQKSPPWLMETPVCHHLPARGRQLLQQIGSRDAGRRRARCPVMGSCPPKWERANVPRGGCEGVGRAARLERSRRGPHTGDSHVAPTRAAPALRRGGSWHQQQRGWSPKQIQRSRGIAGRGWSSSVAHFPPPRHPFISSHGCPAARSRGANATSLFQPVMPTFRSGERAVAYRGAPCPGSGGKSRALARGQGFGASLQGLCLVWFQHSLFNSNNWRRLGRKELFVKG